MSTIGEKINYLLKERGLRPKQFAELTGYNESTLSRTRKQDVKPREKNLQILMNYFNKSKEYFLNDKIPKEAESKNAPAEIPLVYEGKKVPLVDGEFLASIVPQGLTDTIVLRNDTFIHIPMFSRGEFAIQVTGTSMKGYINHGDWCIIRRIKDVNRIIYGEPYVVVSKTNIQRTVKFVNRCVENEEFLWLSPYNQEQHNSAKIEKSDILEMYEVIGIMRKLA